MLTNDSNSRRQKFSGDWQVVPVPLDAEVVPETLSFAEAQTVPDSTHLQLALYPDNPYWGDHLRPINEQAWVYRREFVAPDTPHQRARLLFEGVDYFASVWLNGQFIGEHEGHFAPFVFDVTDAIRHGEVNTLLVRVSSPWDPPNPNGMYPTDHVLRGLVKGLYEHSEGVIPPNVNPLGIWRPVWLLLDEGVSVDQVRIRTKIDGTVDLHLTATNASDQPWQGTLALDIAAENHDGPGVAASIPLELAPGESHIDQTLTVPDPQLWWPWDHGDPNLYRLTASLYDAEKNTLSTLTETFGLREVELERSAERFTYRINGRPVFLRGSSYMPGLYMSQIDRDALARDLALARDACLNLLRVHVHVSPPELYDLCDRAGMLIWQDSELNWAHDPSPEFEVRARAMQGDMIDLLGNHPSIITWACHNEPTMILVRRQNLEQHPDPALYADALEQDPTRPVFICSGQLEDDWQRAGDAHTYYGAIWSKNYTDVYGHHYRLNTEFGFEAPGAAETLRTYPDVWERLKHLEGQIDDLWAYQAELTQFHVEHLRRLRATGSAGYVHFWLADLVPQVGCGVLDADRKPKGGYAALRLASQPLHIALEHDGRQARAVWVFNDTPNDYGRVSFRFEGYDDGGNMLVQGGGACDIAANASQQVMRILHRGAMPLECARIEMTLRDNDENVLARNTYQRPFQPARRPDGYPWKFDPVLGVKVFNRPDAPSMADQNISPIFKWIPLAVREKAAERILRQHWPLWFQRFVGRIGDRLLG